MIRYLVFSLLLASCATVQKPNASLCVVNAYAEHLKCYNIATDYTDDGQLKKSAIATYKNAESVMDLNKGVFMTNNDWAKVKTWIRELRKASERGKK